MAKIKIRDLPTEQKVSKGDMKKILGGWILGIPAGQRVPKPLVIKSISRYSPFLNPVAQEQEDEHVME